MQIHTILLKAHCDTACESYRINRVRVREREREWDWVIKKNCDNAVGERDVGSVYFFFFFFRIDNNCAGPPSVVPRCAQITELWCAHVWIRSSGSRNRFGVLEATAKKKKRPDFIAPQTLCNCIKYQRYQKVSISRVSSMVLKVKYPRPAWAIGSVCW